MALSPSFSLGSVPVVGAEDELAEQLGKMLAEARKEAGFSQAAVASKVGVKDPYISGIETGRLPAPERMLAMIDLYEADPAPFLRLRADIEKAKMHPEVLAALMETAAPPGERPANARPVIASVSCGPFLLGEADPYRATGDVDYLPTERDWTRDKGAFWVRAEGTSMVGAGIEEGDRILVEPNTLPKDGDLAVVVMEGEATLKRWEVPDEKGAGKPFVVLQPANPAFKARPILKSEWQQKRGKASRVAGWLPGFRRAK